MRIKARTALCVAFLLATSPLAPPAWAQSAESKPAGDALDAMHQFQSLLSDYVALTPPPFRASQEELRAWREQVAPTLAELIQRAEQLAETSGGSPDVLLLLALCHAKLANIQLDQRRGLDRKIADLRAAGQQVPPDLLAEQADQAIHAAAQYRRIVAALRQALAAADALRERREMGLVQGVILAQTAIVEDRAIDAADTVGKQVPFGPAELRQFLDDAQGLLREYLESTPLENGLEWVRGRFYLGVVEYRRALRPRVPGEEYFTEVDPARLDAFEQAREVFTTLSTPEAVLKILRPHADEEAQRQSPAGRAYETSSFRLQADYSYDAVARYYAASSNMYLGLMAAIDPTLEQASMQDRYDAVRRFMDRAVELDHAEPSPGQEPISLTADTIPTSRQKVLDELKRALEAPARRPINDVTFSVGGAYLWDTNVTLLGDRTAPTGGVSRKSDSRFATRLRLNWVADLDTFDPGNENLRRWQVFVEGRVDSTWNARIEDFNEQFYGGTVNLRYELFGPDRYENIDGLYFHLRYDYDQIVLGNDGFLSLNRVRPSFQLIADEGEVDVSAFFSYEIRDYSEFLRDDRFNRDGDYFSFGSDARFDLGDWVEGGTLWGDRLNWGCYAPHEDDPDYRRPMELAVGYEYTSNSTKGDEFDYSSHIISTGLRFPLPMGVDCFFSGAWEWQNYWRHSLVDRHRGSRTDLVQEYAFRAERKFYLSDYSDDYQYVRPLQLSRTVLTLFGEIRWIIDDNDVVDRLGQRPFEYDRAIYTVGLRLDFN